MYSRLLKYLENQKVLIKNQFGFRKLHSAYMALIVLMDKIINALNNGNTVIGLFLDFSKAFDTVNHDILLDKLSHYGIRGVALKWFQSYLSNRKQFVTYNDVASNTKIVSCGVPKGSILGPLLFLIYINDLYYVCKESVPILFADDTNLFYSGNSFDDIAMKVNEELVQISNWLKANRLSLNISKTHYMVFSRNKKIFS